MVNKHSFICPECGGAKSQNAKVCQSCYLAGKGVVDPQRLVCPDCDGEKTPRSKLCKSCTALKVKRYYESAHADSPGTHTCPDCGGLKKSLSSLRCKPCSDAKRTKNPRYANCVICGKSKTNLQHPRCMGCKAEAQISRSRYSHCEACGEPKVGQQELSPLCYSCSRHPEGQSEKECAKFITSLYGGELARNDRKLLDGRELDILALERSVAIEFNGDYWHTDKMHRVTSEEPTAADKHLSKFLSAQKIGITLAFVWEWDWNNNRTEVEDALLVLFDTGELRPILHQMNTPHPYLQNQIQD